MRCVFQLISEPLCTPTLGIHDYLNPNTTQEDTASRVVFDNDKEIAYTERAKLFDLIEELVKWENSNNPRVINAARLEIARSFAANKVADKELKDDTP